MPCYQLKIFSLCNKSLTLTSELTLKYQSVLQPQTSTPTTDSYIFLELDTEASQYCVF